jgi:RNA polymerase sigma-70 factor (ECF subfamily)
MNVGKVYALCLRLLADPEIAEKLTVEVFLVTWRKISLFREGILFSSWLTGITTHTILEWIRSNNEIWNYPDQKKLKLVKDSLIQKNTDPFEIDIRLLPGKERFVFVLHEIENYTDVEVADLLSLTLENFNDILQKSYELLNLPIDSIDKKAYIQSCLNSLPQIIQPEKDIWKYIFTVLDKEQNSLSNKLDGNSKKSEGENENDQKKKKFGFLNWKKK